MKFSHLRLTLVLPACLLFAGSFTSLKDTPAKARQVYYYWYDEPQDTYDNYDTTADMINTWENLLGVMVNTNPAGGTLIVEGYNDNVYPHDVPPTVFLYAH